jgi:hypothetical protein
LGHPFRNIDVPYIKRVKQFGNLPIKLPIFRTDVPSSQHSDLASILLPWSFPP